MMADFLVMYSRHVHGEKTKGEPKENSLLSWAENKIFLKVILSKASRIISLASKFFFIITTFFLYIVVYNGFKTTNIKEKGWF